MRIRISLISLAAGLCIGAACPALAQSGATMDTTLQDLEMRLRNQSSGSGLLGTQDMGYQPQILRPNLPYAYRLPASDLELYYSKRAGVDLRQFGYEAFGRPSTVTVQQMGALQDTYVVGIGDNISVAVVGQQNQTFDTVVGREGNVIIQGVPPIPAAGRRLGDVRADIEMQVKTAYLATQVYVSIGAVRQITILVTGEVLSPGAVSLSALNSPMDALLLAGGVKKTGSLRNIKIIRGDQEVPLDLYSILSAADGSTQLSLTDGDRIVVPTIGPTVAVGGDVTRPGIYEVGAGSSGMTARRLLALAGGYSRGGSPRLSALKVQSSGAEVMSAVSGSDFTLRKGDILFVQPTSDVARGRVVVSGQVRVKGTFDLARMPTLKAALGSPDLYEEQPYMLFAAISRRDPATMSRKIVPFAPLQVVMGQFDLPLQDDDIIRVFSVPEVRDLAAQLAIEDASNNPDRQDLRSKQQLLGIQSRGGSTAAPVTSQGTVSAALAGQTSESLAMMPQLSQRAGSAAANRQSAIAGSASLPSGVDANAAAQTQAGAAAQPADRIPLSQLPITARQGWPNRTSDSGNQATNRFDDTPSANDLDLLTALDQTLNYDPSLQPFSSRNLVLDLTDPSVRGQIANYRMSLLGAVQVPGDYLAAPGVGLDGLVAVAGGLTITADLTGVEVTSTDLQPETGKAQTTRASFSVPQAQLGRIVVHPRDVVRVREIYTDRDGGQVVVRGQVRFPGSFDILRGERLSSLLARAGGLTDIAYPYGAVFTRSSAARAEEDGYRRAAEELEREFTVLVTDESVSPQGVQFVRDTIARLQAEPGVGRISVEADPIALAANPERDMILEPGDFLFIPRRPNSISVTGEILSAGSFLFRSGAGGRHYIELAGGYAPAADRGRTFILMPDGSARPLTGSMLSFRQAALVPGATIIVPRDLRPFRFRRFALDFSQIFSQLAVSAASIAVISRDN